MASPRPSRHEPFVLRVDATATTGVLLGGGRRNHIHDNVFLSNDKDVAFDDRGLTWQQTTCQQNCTHAYPPGSTSCFYNALAAVNYKQPPYATRYPEIVNIYEDHPCLPVGNVIENNRWCHRGSKPGHTVCGPLG